MIFLDTNVIIDVLGTSRPQVRHRLGEIQTSGEQAAISSIVLFELRYRVANSARPEDNRRKLDAVLAGGIEVVTFDADDGREAGALKAFLRRAGGEIGPYDLLIAAQARRRTATLVTHNLREFNRVPGLTVVDWAE